MTTYTSVVSVGISPLSFLILFETPLSPPPWVGLAIGCVHFVSVFKEPAFSFINLSYCLGRLHFIYFHGDLCYFLPLPDFGIHFRASLSSSLRCCKLCVLEIFLVSCGRHILL